MPENFVPFKDKEIKILLQLWFGVEGLIAIEECLGQERVHRDALKGIGEEIMDMVTVVEQVPDDGSLADIVHSSEGQRLGRRTLKVLACKMGEVVNQVSDHYLYDGEP